MQFKCFAIPVLCRGSRLCSIRGTSSKNRWTEAELRQLCISTWTNVSIQRCQCYGKDCGCILQLDEPAGDIHDRRYQFQSHRESECGYPRPTVVGVFSYSWPWYIRDWMRKTASCNWICYTWPQIVLVNNDDWMILNLDNQLFLFVEIIVDRF